MKTKEDHLLHCVGEECGELVQVTGKIGRFGVYDSYNGKMEVNILKLRKEFHDIVAVYGMFCREIGITSEIDPALIKAKEERVLVFMEYARKIGRLEPEKCAICTTYLDDNNIAKHEGSGEIRKDAMGKLWCQPCTDQHDNIDFAAIAEKNLGR